MFENGLGKKFWFENFPPDFGWKPPVFPWFAWLEKVFKIFPDFPDQWEPCLYGHNPINFTQKVKSRKFLVKKSRNMTI